MGDQATLDRLLIATRVVGAYFGEHADCAAAAALLMMTAEPLGFRLTPRPVSVIAHQASTNRFMLMGSKAYDAVPESRTAYIENLLPEGRNTGHMILTSDEPPLLLDPNIRQLGAYGMPVPSVSMRIESSHPDDGQWGFTHGDVSVSYMVDDANTSLWGRYADATHGLAESAGQLAALILAGWSAERIAGAMTPFAPG